MSDTNYYPADADVIQGARGVRMSPAQLALANALMGSSGTSAPPGTQPDPSAGMGTHSAPGHNGGPTPSAPDMSDAGDGSGSVGNGPVKTAPASGADLFRALANAPLPPVRPANLGAPAAPSIPANDPTFSALISQGRAPLATSPVPLTPQPQTTGAIASPPPSGSATMGDLTIDTPMGSATLAAAQPARPVTPTPAPAAMYNQRAAQYAADPGAAQRAAQYAALNPTGSTVGVPPAAFSAIANPPGVPGTGNGILPTPHPVGALMPQGAPVSPSASIAVAPGSMSASAAPAPSAARPNAFDDITPPTSATTARPNAFDDITPRAATGNASQPNTNFWSLSGPGWGSDKTVGQTAAALGQTGEDAMRNIIAGVPFAERGGALVNSAVSGDSYSSELAKVKADRQAAESRQGPIGSAIEKGAGALATAAPIAAAAAPLGAVPYTLGVLPDIATGAALGGSSAASDAPDLTAQGAATRAAIGAGLGAGAGLATTPLSWAAGKLAGAVANRGADSAFNASGAAGNAGLDTTSADAINAAISAQRQTPAEAVKTAQSYGPGATLADSGEGTQQMTSRLAATDPAISPLIEQNLNARNEPIVTNLTDAINGAVGPDVNAAKQMADLKANTAKVGQGYTPILNSDATVDVTPVRDMIASTRVDPIAAGVKEDPISAALGKAHGYFVGVNPSALPIKVAHQAQTAIGDMADSAARAGNNAQARVLTNVRQGILEQMPPEYNAVRQQYASAKDLEDAFGEGQSLLAPRSDGQMFDPDLLQKRLSGMSDPEQQAYRLGARKAVSDVMGTARSNPAGLQTKFSNENGYAVGKLRAVFGDQPTDDLLNAMKAQGIMARTNNLATQGSKTAMASSVNNALPNAKLIGGGHEDGFTPIYAGAELGGSLGLPGRAAGMAIGAGWNALVKPAINAARQQAATATRNKIAAALTGAPTQDVSDALTARLAQQNAMKTSGSSASALARAIMRPAAANQSGSSN